MKKIKLLTPQMQLLSPRQLEIFILLGKGKNYHQIGELLFISHRTVQTHRNEIFRRMGFTHIYHLIHYAVRSKFDRDNINFNEE